MSKNPKIVPIRDSFKELFPEEESVNMSSTEITRKMRNIMKSDNK